MTKNRRYLLLIILLCLLVGWIFWFPAARAGYFFRYGEDYPNPDFVAYYVAGQALSRGYNPYLDNHEADPDLFDVRPGGFSRFIYPPTLVPFYSLLGKLPYKYARAVWFLVNLGVLGGALFAFIRQAQEKDRLPLLAAGSLLLLTSQPLLFHIQQGQVDMLVAGTALLAWTARNRGWKNLSALLLALAFFAKVNPIVLLAAFVLYFNDWGYLLRFGAACCVIFAISLAVVPFQLYLDFFNLVLPYISSGRGFFVNQSLIRLVAYQPVVPQLLSLSGFAACAVFGWVTGLRQRKAALPRPEMADLVLFANILAMLLFSGVAWHMAYVWVIIPAARLLAHLHKRSGFVFLGLYGLACILMNSTVDEPLYLQSTNLIGGSLMLVLLAALAFAPRFFGIQPQDDERSS